MTCEIYRESIVNKSRKDHQCNICRETIPKGSTYKSINSLFDGEFTETKVCDHCIPILEKFFDIHYGELDCGYTYEEVREDVRETVINNCSDRSECISECIKCDYAVKKYLEYEHKEFWND
jgi:hypothetical protein